MRLSQRTVTHSYLGLPTSSASKSKYTTDHGAATDPTLYSWPAAGNNAIIYSSGAIAKHTGIGLSRGGMVLIALLSGGDYNPVRIQHARFRRCL
jgi:hypothetical protein